MKKSKRIGSTAVAGVLMLAMLAPSAEAVAPGRTIPRAHCSSDSELRGRWREWHWNVSLTVKNNRNHRATVYGSWDIEGRFFDGTVHRHAELAAGARATFTKRFDGWFGEELTIDLRRCRS